MATSDAEGKVDDSDKSKVFDEAEDKGKTFRKRRLSLTKIRQLDNDSDSDSDDDDDNDASQNVDRLAKLPFIQTEMVDSIANENGSNDKAHTFRKRRLSLTSNNSEAATSFTSATEEHNSQGNPKRLRKASDASAEINLQSKTLHAAEILSPSPTDSALLPKFYQQAAPPQQLSLSGGSELKTPKWKERHIRPHEEDDKSLPFPRDIVGTFSCHGVEPIYDDNDSDDGDEDSITGNKSGSIQKKLTMAAKINQDRGGVAFPYGNSRTTALFAVYDGTYAKQMNAIQLDN
jgi:hypothetical protein